MVHWDVVAGVAAVVGLPLMFNSTFIWLLQKLFAFILRSLWHTSGVCERLEWRDVPDGNLHDCSNKCTPRCSNITYVTHCENGLKTDEDCFGSTLSVVFQRAWISSERRQRSVRKPQQLELGRKYIRTDVMMLKAYLLICYEMVQQYQDQPVIQFREVDGVMTAHLTADFAIYDPNLTKGDVELLLKGYPPFYRRSISLPNGDIVSSPIKSMQDAARGGWIVAVGLARSQPGSVHNMAYNSAYEGGVLWKHTVMKNAVERVGQVLEGLRNTFPTNEKVRYAIGRYAEMLSSFSACSWSHQTYHHERFYEGMHDKFEDWYWYADRLSAEQWELALNAFNHRPPLSSEEAALFQTHMDSILFATLRGLCAVLVYGDYTSETRPGPWWKLPSLPELSGRKYIYLTSCLGDGE